MDTVEDEDSTVSLLTIIGQYEPEFMTQEKKLLGGILEQAVRDIVAFNQRPSEKNRIRMIDAAEWIDSDDTEPFSYLWILEIFDIPPAVFYRKLAIFVKKKKNYSRKKDL